MSLYIKKKTKIPNTNKYNYFHTQTSITMLIITINRKQQSPSLFITTYLEINRKPVKYLIAK